MPILPIDAKGGWNEHKVELTLWTFVTASKLSPDLLSTLPKHKGKESDLFERYHREYFPLTKRETAGIFF